MPYEAISTDLYQLTNKAVRLNPGSGTDSDTALNLAERPDKDIVTQTAFIEIAWRDNLDASTVLYVANADLQQSQIGHRPPPSLQC
jgi:hypothetical protein